MAGRRKGGNGESFEGICKDTDAICGIVLLGRISGEGSRAAFAGDGGGIMYSR